MVRVSSAHLLHSLALAALAAADSDYPYNCEKVRGLNLGSWFVLEPYMVPSLFTDNFPADNIPVDEYHFSQQLGKDKAQQILEQHWSSWITESDFQQIAAWGFNTVRIPIGYWAYLARDEDPYVQGQDQYLEQALGWARSNGISAWIDIHGVPGSQNGYDNSGLRLDADATLWAGNETLIDQTLQVLQTITTKYGTSDYADVVSGIEIVNEPNGILVNHNADGVQEYYSKAVSQQLGSTQTTIIVHDAFQDPGYWDSFFQQNNLQSNAVLDHHHYEVFDGPQLEQTLDQHIQAVCTLGSQISQEGVTNKLVGEWSAALDDCAYWLNGVGRGARYDGQYDGVSYIGSCQGNNDVSAQTQQQLEDKRRFIEAQLDAYEQGNGWIFWSYKTENLLDWDVRALIQNGLFPQPLSDRKYPGQCGFTPDLSGGSCASSASSAAASSTAPASSNAPAGTSNVPAGTTTAPAETTGNAVGTATNGNSVVVTVENTVVVSEDCSSTIAVVTTKGINVEPSEVTSAPAATTEAVNTQAVTTEAVTTKVATTVATTTEAPETSLAPATSAPPANNETVVPPAATSTAVPPPPAATSEGSEPSVIISNGVAAMTPSLITLITAVVLSIL